MPQYGFECQACRKPFEIDASMSEYAAMQKNKSVVCPECGSKKIGLLSDDPSEVAQMAAERSDLEKVSERFKGVYKEAIESGELVGAYGLPAALALAAKGISKPIMITLATSKMGDLDYFVDTILREERAAMKARMRRLRQ